jgi:PAS domain S-box-containing protein
MNFIIDKVLDKIKKDVVEEQAIVIVNDSYNVIYCNEVYEKITGYSIDELKGKKIDTIGVDDKLNKFFKEKYKEKIKSGECIVIFKNRKKNGEIFYILSKIKRIEIDKKKYYYGLVFDINDIINDLSLFLFELDIGSVFFNDINERILVAVKDGDKFEFLFFSDLLKDLIDSEIKKKIKEFCYSDLDKIILKIDDKYYKVVKFSFDYKNVLNSEYIIIKFIDVTNEYRILEEKERKIKIKQEFISSIIHDINTPLSIINGFLKFIKSSLKDNLDDFCKSITNDEYKILMSYLDSIENNVEYLTDLMNDLLELNRFELNGKININKTYFNIKELESLFNLYKFRAMKKKLLFEVVIDDNLKDKLIYSDIIRIKQIISNLLSNAIKFTEKGFVKIFIKCENNNLKIIVKDTGIGIDSKKLKTIFNLYERENGLYEGHGIGMFVIKNIVDALNGSIDIKSEKNNGTIVEVSIPIEWKKVKADDDEKECEKNDFNILIAEDDEIMQTIYKKFLQENGYENIIFIDNCSDLKNEINKNYDLFIIDNKLVDCNTIDIIKDLVSIDKKILFVSGNNEIDFVDKFNNVYYLKKPFDYSRLISIINEFLCEK